MASMISLGSSSNSIVALVVLGNVGGRSVTMKQLCQNYSLASVFDDDFDRECLGKSLGQST